MESYYELKNMLCKELNEIVQESKGKLSAGALDAIDKMTHSIKSLVTIMAMEEGGYSNDGYSGARQRDSMGRYMDAGPSYSGGSYGRYYDRAMDGYSGRRYSRDEGKSHMLHQLEEMMQQATNPEERETMQQAINRLRGM